MLRKIVISAMTVAAVAIPAASATAGPVAHASKGCGYSRSLGFTYVNKIKAKGTTCKKAKNVIKAYHSAGAGERTVSGYKCTDTVLDKSPFQYDASASC